MWKRKDAFALSDFDATRILQRQWFRNFHFDADKSDAEILQSFEVDDDDSFETIQKKFDEIDDLVTRTIYYQRHLKRHGERLTVYEKKLANKIASDDTADIVALRSRFERANNFSRKYCGCVTAVDSVTTFFLGGIVVNDVGGLIQKIVDCHKALDEEIKRHYRKVLATRLKQARKEKGLTQAALAEKMNMTQSGYTSYEIARRDPSIPTLVRLSKELNRPVDWLLGLS